MSCVEAEYVAIGIPVQSIEPSIVRRFHTDFEIRQSVVSVLQRRGLWMFVPGLQESPLISGPRTRGGIILHDCPKEVVHLMAVPKINVLVLDYQPLYTA